MIGDFVETFPGVVPFVSENDVDSKSVTLLEDLLELFVVRSSPFGDQTMDDFLGNQVDEDMDFFEILLLLNALEADLYPCSFPVGFQPTGINPAQHNVAWKKQAVYVSQNAFIKIGHGVLNGLITRCSSHPKRLINLQIIRCVRYPSIGKTEEDLEQE